MRIIDPLPHSPRSVKLFPETTCYKPKSHPVKPFKNANTPTPPPPKAPDGPNSIAPEGYSKIHNEITDEDLKILLAVSTATSGVCDKYLNAISSWKLDVDLRPVRFSSRFSALWVKNRNNIVWFCVVDSEFVVFSISDGTEFKIEKPKDAIPHITLPFRGTKWSTFQDALVDRFEKDDHVRAISAAVMLSSNPTGEYSTVAKELLPAALRDLKARLTYNSPMDEDMMTVLSDAKTTDRGKTLFFECGGGYCARSTTNATKGRITRMQKPKKSVAFEETSDILMPFVFQ